jgi:hypothetical protein
MKHLLLIACLFLPTQFSRAADPVPGTASEANGFSGKVLETTNASSYTYVLVDAGGKKIWAATTRFAVKVGDQVNVGPGTPMSHYHSGFLNRDFDSVYFTSSITVGGVKASVAGTPALPAGHPALNGGTPILPPGHALFMAQKPSAKVDLSGIKRADGGETIQEIFAAKSMLAGKLVAVRGKVVRYNAMILGKNWLHIQDGSGSAEKNDNDLTITTTTPAKLGDTVLVTGTVSTNKDFGAGYKYTVILDDAKVTVE